jgi:hypothetical protein
MRDKDLVNYQSGYEHMAVFAVVIVAVLCVWMLWIGSCERKGLAKFDQAIGLVR